jgi:hypothetical protein
MRSGAGCSGRLRHMRSMRAVSQNCQRDRPARLDPRPVCFMRFQFNELSVFSNECAGLPPVAVNSNAFQAWLDSLPSTNPVQFLVQCRARAFASSNHARKGWRRPPGVQIPSMGPFCMHTEEPVSPLSPVYSGDEEIQQEATSRRNRCRVDSSGPPFLPPPAPPCKFHLAFSPCVERATGAVPKMAITAAPSTPPPTAAPAPTSSPPAESGRAESSSEDPGSDPDYVSSNDPRMQGIDENGNRLSDMSDPSISDSAASSTGSPSAISDAPEQECDHGNAQPSAESACASVLRVAGNGEDLPLVLPAPESSTQQLVPPASPEPHGTLAAAPAPSTPSVSTPALPEEESASVKTGRGKHSRTGRAYDLLAENPFFLYTSGSLPVTAACLVANPHWAVALVGMQGLAVHPDGSNARTEILQVGVNLMGRTPFYGGPSFKVMAFKRGCFGSASVRYMGVRSVFAAAEDLLTVLADETQAEAIGVSAFDPVIHRIDQLQLLAVNERVLSDAALQVNVLFIACGPDCGLGTQVSFRPEYQMSEYAWILNSQLELAAYIATAALAYSSHRSTNRDGGFPGADTQLPATIPGIMQQPPQLFFGEACRRVAFLHDYSMAVEFKRRAEAFNSWHSQNAAWCQSSHAVFEGRLTLCMTAGTAQAEAGLQ